MRPEASAVPASPLTVWVGSMRYAFPPGRDVVVGYGAGADIPLEQLGGVPPQAPRPEVLLRFLGTHWVAIDKSRSGIFSNGFRVPAVDIHDGQAITLGDPQHGPRLVFEITPPVAPQIAPPVGPPGPHQGPAHPPPAPTQRDTGPMRIPTQSHEVERPSQPAPPPVRPFTPPVPPVGPAAAPAHPPAASSPVPPAAPPPPVPAEHPPPPEPAAAGATEQLRAPGLIERMRTRKLRAAAPSFRTEQADPTFRLPMQAGARTVGVAAHHLGLVVDGRALLTDVSFTARPGTLTAVIGPSAARNSALLGMLAGTRKLSSGRITVDDHNVHAEPVSMRTRIGIVARDDRLHRQLTVGRAVDYAAKLRLPPDTLPEHRRRVVDQILEELELTPYRSTRISKLPPEARRCTALAVELTTRPTLLVVDEPGAGLDAGQESHVMAVLRRQADIGCVVVVAMNSPTSPAGLNMCDQVVVLTATGSMAFAGTPLQIQSLTGSTDWSTILGQVSADPAAARAQQPAAPPPAAAAPWPPPAELSASRQIRLVIGRQLRLLLASRVYSVFLVLLPFVLAALTLLIPGNSGLGKPNPASPHLHEAIEILAALNVSAVLIGAALGIREVVGERRVFRREQAVGLSTPAYVAGKLIFVSVAAAILTAITFSIVVVGKGAPVHGAAALQNATIELYVSVAVTAIVSAIVALALSALANSLREVVPLLLPLLLASVLFNGSLVQLASRWGFQQISWFVPAQWGFAASASTADLRRIDALAANAQMWTHYSGWWAFDMIMLTGFGVLGIGFILYRLRSPNPVDRAPAS
ncbi:ABC transporter [Mycobacterium sp. IS-2888]|uniref:ATP-binding cassette domain-containing protein n=1 Tax=Mycobacterium sp. IS-2888 TaxID=1834159 RepID=UPI00096C7C75|nr:ATP-binding cassette domain-containing protein [Mycobacterium sp. IS-2888]OMC48721.1 ABC transporter [Mycobacterium sp. IS-2888]